MKRLLLGCLILSLFTSFTWGSWGFYAHKKINEMAVYILPGEMLGFYGEHQEFISQHAVDPDKRKHRDTTEAGKHFIDLDVYVSSSEEVDGALPKKWSKAIEKFSLDTLLEYGVLPWNLEREYYSLKEAFEQKDVKKILQLSADIGHYVGDAHVPLHTTKNYDGQYTGQRGIHSFWESRIPELQGGDYDYFVGGAKFIKNKRKWIWDIVKTSFSLRDSVLNIEKRLGEEFDADRKYTFESRGNKTVKTYSREYTLEYARRLNGMVERQMRRSIMAVGSIWYTAWVEAGQPDLEKLLPKKGGNGKDPTD